MTWDGRRLALDLSAYRQLGFYQLLDPNGPRVYGHHVYRSALMLFLAAVQLVVVFAAAGFLADGDGDGTTTTSPFEIIVILVNCTLSSLKMYTLVRHADVVWTLCEMACADFLRCGRRQTAAERDDLARRWRRATAVTNAIARSFVAGMLLWFYGPFIDRGGNRGLAATRRPNVVNAVYPVTARFYNEHYYAFYAMEAAVGLCIVYGSVLVDAYLMSFCWIVAAQYRSVAAAYGNFGHAGADEQLAAMDSTEIYEEFKSIIVDHQNVYLKMKSFYAVVRPITLIHVFAYSCSLITYAYVIVTIFHSDEPFVVVEIMKIAMTVSNVTIEVFIFCYLFELVNDKKEAVNTGLYSCNWTGMDIKFKKLLLMSMKMNNANQLKLKATPNITVDRSFFANVIHTCFNIVSVLIQTQSKN